MGSCFIFSAWRAFLYLVWQGYVSYSVCHRVMPGFSVFQCVCLDCRRCLSSLWFPKKKGLALGWATMGNNLASATIVLIITELAQAFGSIQMSITIIGIVAALWAWFTLDNPEQAGATLDIVPMSQDQIKAYRTESENYVYDDYRRSFELAGTALNGSWL